MGMCAIYQEVKKEDFKKLLESDDFFETIEELEEKDGTELCDIDKMWDALHFLLNGLSAIYGAPEDNLLIGGDLLTTNRAGVLSAPMKEYTADMPKALETAHTVLKEYSHAILSVAHGGEVKLSNFENGALVTISIPV